MFSENKILNLKQFTQSLRRQKFQEKLYSKNFFSKKTIQERNNPEPCIQSVISRLKYASSKKDFFPKLF